MMKLCLFLVAAVGLLGYAAAVAGEADISASASAKLGSLCARKSPNIADHLEMGAMIKLVKEGKELPQDCSPSAQDALLDLEPVLAHVDDICSRESIDQITLFWAKWMDRKSKQRKLIPKPVRKFFIMFGFFASQSCKQSLVDNILKEDKISQFITAQDIEFVAHLTDGDKLSKVVGDTMEIEDLFLVADFETVRRKQGVEQEAETVLVSREKNYLVEQIKGQCKKRLQPAYENLVMPPVKLALLGFSYKSDTMNADLKELYKLESYKNLFKIVLACEPILKYKFEVKPESVVTEEGNTALVTVLSEEEVAKLRAKAGLPPKDVENPVEETSEAPVFAPKSKLIWDHSAVEHEKRLKKAVKSYSRQLKERDLVRLQLVKRSVALYKVWLTSTNLRVGLKELHASRRTALVNSLDQYGASDTRREPVTTVAYLIFAVKLALSVAVGFAMHALLPIAPHLAPLIWICGILIIVVLLFSK